jgi:gamma-glutamylcyclotransferase (GGCT)/AIG2-like uncharacterized protein YtfP
MDDKENLPWVRSDPNSKSNPPSIPRMVRKFLNAKPASGNDPKRTPRPPRPFQPKFFFLYGTLMDPKTLAAVLDLDAQPQLQPAKVVGYHYKMWGGYPALFSGPTGAEVEGVAFKVHSAEQTQRLQDYETKYYDDISCFIRLADGSRVLGKTFIWSELYGRNEELHEGVFSLEDYQKEQEEMNSALFRPGSAESQ